MFKLKKKLIPMLVILSLLFLSIPSVVYAAADPPISTISLSAGSGPSEVAFNPVTNILYTVNAGANSVSVINGATNTVTATIPVGLNPYGIAVNTTNNTIYVANNSDSSVTVIDGSNNTVTATITTGLGSCYVLFNPLTNTVYVTNSNDSTVSLIDCATNTVIKTIPVGAGSYGIALNTATGDLYVVNNSDCTVSVISGVTNTLTATIAVGLWPCGVGYNPNTNSIYVANGGGNSISVINCATDTVTTTIPSNDVGNNGPYDVAVNTTTNTIYVTDDTSNSLLVIDGSNNTITSSIPVGVMPYGVVVNLTANTVYVANNTDNNLSVIKFNTAATPTGLSFTKLTNTSYSISWNAVLNSAGYVLNVNGVDCPTDLGTSHALDGVILGTTYNVKVASISNSIKGAYSNSVTFITSNSIDLISGIGIDASKALAGTGSIDSPLLINSNLFKLNLSNIKQSFVQISKDSLTWTPWAQVKFDGTYQKPITFTGGDGNYTLNVVTSNTSATDDTIYSLIKSFYFVVDTTKPDFKLHTQNGSFKAINGTINLCLVAKDASNEPMSVSVIVFDKNMQQVTSQENIAIVQNAEVIIPISGMPSKSFYYATIIVKDMAGNASKQTVTISTK